MKKIFVVFLAAAFIFTGCGETADAGQAAEGKERISAKDRENIRKDAEEGETEEENALPGSYTVPDGWVKAEAYSTEDKIFYVEEGHENEELPDNISINVGTNRYSADEHETFREAIVRQLLMQIKGMDAKLGGEGTYTEQGSRVYIFTIEEEDVVTRQYYIVDDYRYCLIHLTNYTGSEDAYEAARAMADSFVWDNHARAAEP